MALVELTGTSKSIRPVWILESNFILIIVISIAPTGLCPVRITLTAK
jgi:hypothetical protein